MGNTVTTCYFADRNCKLLYYLLFNDTASKMLLNSMSPQHDHEPKQRKAWIEEGERLLRANGRR